MKLIREQVPDGTLRTARSRIVAHLDKLNMVDFDLAQLAVNCYLQGARDMAETVISRRLVLFDNTNLDFKI